MTTDLMRGLAVTSRGSLLRAEILRMRSRRFVRVLLLLALVLLVVVGVGQFVSHGEPDAREIAAAKSQAAESTAACISSSPGLPVDQQQQACQVPWEGFVTTSPFVAADDLPNIATALAAGMAALLFLIGTTSGGADWSAKTMPALLFWEPRRVRVLLTKLAVVVGVAVAVAAATQVLWTAMGAVVASSRGTWDGRPPDFWSQLFWLDLRGGLLIVLAGAGGYALSSIIRNTGAALGVTFVYLVIIENVVRQFLGSLRPYLLGENIAATLTKGGVDVLAGQHYVAGRPDPQPIIIHLSNVRAGLTLTLMVAVLTVLAAVLFRRRDLT